MHLHTQSQPVGTSRTPPPPSVQEALAGCAHTDVLQHAADLERASTAAVRPPAHAHARRKHVEGTCILLMLLYRDCIPPSVNANLCAHGHVSHAHRPSHAHAQSCCDHRDQCITNQSFTMRLSHGGLNPFWWTCFGFRFTQSSTMLTHVRCTHPRRLESVLSPTR